MTSKNIFFTFGFWVELPQILGLGSSVQSDSCTSFVLPATLVKSGRGFDVERGKLDINSTLFARAFLTGTGPPK